MTQAAADRRALVDKLAADLQARVMSGELASGTRLRQEADNHEQDMEPIRPEIGQESP